MLCDSTNSDGEVTCPHHEQAIAGLRSFGELETRFAAVRREVTKIQVRFAACVGGKHTGARPGNIGAKHRKTNYVTVAAPL